MIFGKERPADLRGVFSNAAAFWSGLPSKCSKNEYLNCGNIDLVLPEPLLRLFEIKTDVLKTRQLRISVYSLNDGYGRGMARIFAEVEGVKATFQITSMGGGDGDVRRLNVQREFSDGRVNAVQVKSRKRDGFFLAALNELVGLKTKDAYQTEKDLLCRSCPAKINGLPGSIP